MITVLMKNPNLLILDEPTNDLDIQTLSVLEDYLASFEGCVLIVTHDRFFMDRVADHIWAFEGDGEISVLNGNYYDYRQKLKEQKREQKKEATVVRGKPEEAASNKKRKLSFKEKQEYEKLESEILLLEEEKTMLEQQLGESDLTHEKLMEVSNRFQHVIHEIDAKTVRWMELAELN